MLGRKTSICWRPVRYQCPYGDGHPTTTQQLLWYTPKSAYTKTYEEHILLKLVNSTVQDVCLKEAIGYEAIMGIIDRHIQGEVDWNQFARLDILGSLNLSQFVAAEKRDQERKASGKGTGDHARKAAGEEPRESHGMREAVHMANSLYRTI